MKSQRETVLGAQSPVGAKDPSEPAVSVADWRQNPVDACKARHKSSWKLLFLVTQDFSFWERRRPLAREAQAAGAEVWVMTCPGPFVEKLKLEGFRVVPWHVSRASLNPLHEFYASSHVLRVYL